MQVGGGRGHDLPEEPIGKIVKECSLDIRAAARRDDVAGLDDQRRGNQQLTFVRATNQSRHFS